MSGMQQMLIGGTDRVVQYSGTVNVVYQTDSTIWESETFVSGSLGSASPTTLSDGKTLYMLQSYFTYGTGVCESNYLEIRGFSSDPGSSYLNTIKVGTTTYALSGYGYSPAFGSAAWEISFPAAPWFGSGSGAYTVELA